MSLESALTDRYALWHQVLCDLFGYEAATPTRPPRTRNELAFRAVRPARGRIQPVGVDIRETWLPGADPDLGITLHDCFLFSASWHAQVAPDAGPTGAERLDVERDKPAELVVHRHPLGEPNDVRQPAAPLRHPQAWVTAVEEAIAAYYGY